MYSKFNDILDPEQYTFSEPNRFMDCRQVCDPLGDLPLPADRDYTCEALRAVKLVSDS